MFVPYDIQCKYYIGIRTMIHFDAHFDLKAVLINMLWMHRKSPPICVISDATIPRDLIDNYISAFRGNCYTGIQLILYYKCIYLHLLNVVKVTYCVNIGVYMENGY